MSQGYFTVSGETENLIVIEPHGQNYFMILELDF